MPQTNRTDIDGVPVFWAEIPGPLQAVLVFRVGVRDEEFATVGITHLLEHLAFSRLPAVKHDHNGQVELGVTTFSAAGRPEAVARTLTDICASLAAVAAGDIDPKLLATEIQVIEAEAGLPVPPQVAEVLTLRFGLEGLGLAGAQPSFMDRFTPADLAAHAAAHLTRGNAVLVLSGPPPEGLRLPLPPGERRPYTAIREVPASLPAEYPSGGGQLVLSFGIPGADSPLSYVQGVVGQVLEGRARARLRRGKGLIYDLDVASAHVDPGRGLAIVTADLKPANAVEVAKEVIGMIRELRDHGPTPEELADILAAARDSAQEPDSPLADANDAAMAHLTGLPAWPLARVLEALEGFRQEDLSAYLAGFEATHLLGLPEDAVPEDAGWSGAVYPVHRHVPAALAPGTVYKPALLGRFLLDVPKDARLELADDGVAFTAEGDRRAYRWADVAGIEWVPGEEKDGSGDAATVVGRDGFAVPLVAAWFRRGTEAFKELRSRVPERLQFRAQDGAPGQRA